MPKISAAIMTLNEEEMLPRCLESVAWADEILVVDSHSTDRTVAIAEAAGARVLVHDFAGYAAQCNWMFERTTGDWVLMVDADEIVEPELRDAILETVKAGPRFEVYDVVRDAVFLNKRLYASSWSNERLPRFFRRGCLTFSGLVHPIPDTGGREVGVLGGKMVHYTYRNMEQYFRKFQQYTTLWAKNAHEKGKRTTLFHCTATSVWRFFHNYFLRGEIRDGAYGFLLSFLAMCYTFTKYLKLWDRNRLDDLTRKAAGGGDTTCG